MIGGSNGGTPSATPNSNKNLYKKNIYIKKKAITYNVNKDVAVN
jgi:hypothetical protein